MTLLMFLLWIILNGRITAEVLVFGAVITVALTAFLCAFMDYSLDTEKLILCHLPLFFLYILNLLWETLKAAAAVLILALRPSQHPEPVMVEFRSGLPRDYQNAILANSITLTPGTITVFQEHDRFVVHALRREYAEDIERCSFIRLLRRFP